MSWNLELVVIFQHECQGKLASLKEVTVTKIEITTCEKFFHKKWQKLLLLKFSEVERDAVKQLG